MGILRYIFVAVLACCAMGSLQATNEAPRHQKKHYLDEKDISVTNEGIVVTTKSGSIKVKALRSNSHGIYVCKKDMCEVATKGQIYCLNCRLWMSRDRYYSHLPCTGR